MIINRKNFGRQDICARCHMSLTNLFPQNESFIILSSVNPYKRIMLSKLELEKGLCKFIRHVSFFMNYTLYIF